MHGKCCAMDNKLQDLNIEQAVNAPEKSLPPTPRNRRQRRAYVKQHGAQLARECVRLQHKVRLLEALLKDANGVVDELGRRYRELKNAATES